MANYKETLQENNADLQTVLAAVNNLPEAISVDDTLSIAGQAADAKAVGDALEQCGAAVEQSIKLVKLGGPTTTSAANQTVTFSMSGVDMNEYTALILVAEAAASSGSLNLMVNGSSLLTLCSNNWSQSAAVAWVMPGESKVMGFAQGIYSSSETTNSSSGRGAVALAWNAVTSIGAGGTSYAGMSCTLYGLKV